MWVVNFFIDIANIIVSWIPLICYLGAGILALVSVAAFARLGNPSKEARHDKMKAILSFLTAVMLASFPSYANAWSGSFGFDRTMETGGDLFTYMTNLPQFTDQTPNDFILNKVKMFMPFFMAVGALGILRGVFMIKDGSREGQFSMMRFLAYSAAGAFLMNLDTAAKMILAQAV